MPDFTTPRRGGPDLTGLQSLPAAAQAAIRQNAGLIVPAYTGPLALPPACSAVYSLVRMIGWSGACLRLRRASDNTEMDIGFLGNYVDWVAALLFGGTSKLYVVKFYDQSGNARDAGQTTQANQPVFFLRNGVATIMSDNINNYPPYYAAWLDIPTSVSVDRHNCAAFLAVQPAHTQEQSILLEFGTATGSVLTIQTNASDLKSFDATATTVYGGHPRSQMTVLGTVGASGASAIWRDGASVAGAARTTGSVTGGKLGSTVYGNTYYPRAEYAALVVHPDSTKAAAIDAALRTAFATPASFISRLVYTGDSLGSGYRAGDLGTISREVEALLPGNEIYNVAAFGETQATQYAARVARFGGLYSAARRTIYFVQSGINDISGGTAGATLYSATTTPFVAYLKALGGKVALSTLPPAHLNATWEVGGAKDVERLAYNAAVRGNAAGADWVGDHLSVPTAFPTDTSTDADNTTYYQADKLHWLKSMSVALAPLYAAAVTALRA